jgi:hypothetical protein
MANLLLSTLFSLVSAVTVCPGVKTYIGQSTVQNFMNAYVPYWTNRIETGDLPDQNVSLSFMFTSMDFHLKNIKAPAFDIPTNSGVVEMVAPDYVKISFLGVNLMVSADFDLFWFGHYKGNTSILIKNAFVQVPIRFERVLNKPVIHFDRIDILADKKRFRFSSNNLFLTALGYSQYVWPVNLLEDRLIWAGIEGITKSLNPVLSKFFGDLNYSFPVAGNIAINYGFTNVYISKPGYLTLGVVGGFEIPANPFDYPPVQYMNEIINWLTTEDLRFQVTDFFFYTYFWALCETGYLNATINAGTVPQMANVLTTTALQLVVPELQETFGDNWPIELQCGVAHYPGVTIDPTGVHLNFSVICDMNVVKSIIVTKALTFSWVGISKLDCGVALEDEKMYLLYNITAQNTNFNNFHISYSSIGNVDLKPLENAILFSAPTVIYYLNPMFGRSKIRVPLPGYTVISQTELKISNRAIEVGASATFKFPQ